MSSFMRSITRGRSSSTKKTTDAKRLPPAAVSEGISVEDNSVSSVISRDEEGSLPVASTAVKDAELSSPSLATTVEPIPHQHEEESFPPIDPNGGEEAHPCLDEPEGGNPAVVLSERAAELKRQVLAAQEDPQGYLESPITLERYLEARPTIEESAALLIETVKWRLDGTFLHPMGCPWCIEQPGRHPMRQIGFDRDRRPIILYDFNQATQPTDYQPEEFLTHLAHLLDNGHVTMQPDAPQGFTWILDARGMSWSESSTLVRVFNKQTVGALADHYPQSLGTFIALNTPMFFTSAWAVLRKFIDPSTVQAFRFLRPGSEAHVTKVLQDLLTDDVISWIYAELERSYNSKKKRKKSHEVFRDFWLPPETSSDHDPRGTPEYVQRFCVPCSLRENPNDRLHQPHPNMHHYLMLEEERLQLEAERSKPPQPEVAETATPESQNGQTSMGEDEVICTEVAGDDTVVQSTEAEEEFMLSQAGVEEVKLDPDSPTTPSPPTAVDLSSASPGETKSPSSLPISPTASIMKKDSSPRSKPKSITFTGDLLESTTPRKKATTTPSSSYELLQTPRGGYARVMYMPSSSSRNPTTPMVISPRSGKPVRKLTKAEKQQLVRTSMENMKQLIDSTNKRSKDRRKRRPIPTRLLNKLAQPILLAIERSEGYNRKKPRLFSDEEEEDDLAETLDRITVNSAVLSDDYEEDDNSSSNTTNTTVPAEGLTDEDGATTAEDEDQQTRASHILSEEEEDLALVGCSDTIGPTPVPGTSEGDDKLKQQQQQRLSVGKKSLMDGLKQVPRTVLTIRRRSSYVEKFPIRAKSLTGRVKIEWQFRLAKADIGFEVIYHDLSDKATSSSTVVTDYKRCISRKQALALAGRASPKRRRSPRDSIDLDDTSTLPSFVVGEEDLGDGDDIFQEGLQTRGVTAVELEEELEEEEDLLLEDMLDGIHEETIGDPTLKGIEPVLDEQQEPKQQRKSLSDFFRRSSASGSDSNEEVLSALWKHCGEFTSSPGACGELFLIFDNTYSRIRSKEIRFKVISQHI